MGLSLFGQKNPALIGLDIASSSIKVVELSGGRGRCKLERYSIESLPRGAIVDGNIEQMQTVIDAAKRALRRVSGHARHVALAMPAASVISKKITVVDGLREEEMEVQVETEASQYIPFGLDEVNLDFQVFGPSTESIGDLDTLFVAARKEKVEDRVAIVEEVGLVPHIVDVDSYAAQNALSYFTDKNIKQSKGKIFALFQLGATSTTLTVVVDGQVLYEREQALGGIQLTQDIARTYGMPFEEAEAKKRSGGLPEAYESDLLRPFLESLAVEIARGLQFFYTSTSYSKVDYVLLAGGMAATSGLVELVRQRTQLETAVVDPFLGMEIGGGVNKKQLLLDAPALFVACGLALRRFDE